jgi:hypothetical protein
MSCIASLASTNIIFLDACRTNPLARNLARAMGTRSVEIGRGLAPVESGVGTLISFSTQPGNVALDGAGRNSPFAGALAKRIASSHDDLSALLIDVRNDVRKETENRQVPWEHSALTGRFYFNPTSETAATPQVAVARLSEAAEAWDRTKDTSSITVLEAYIVRYKDTFYAELARARLDELGTVGAMPVERTPSGEHGCYMTRSKQECTANSHCAWVPTEQNGYCRNASNANRNAGERGHSWLHDGEIEARMCGKPIAHGSRRYKMATAGGNEFATRALTR